MTLETRVKAYLQHKLSPMNLVYSKLYTKYKRQEYRNYIEDHNPRLLDVPNVRVKLHRVASRKALRYSKLYEKYLYRPIQNAVCPYKS